MIACVSSTAFWIVWACWAVVVVCWAVMAKKVME